MKNNKKVYMLVFLAWIAYVALSVMAPKPKTNPFHITPSQTLQLQISIFVPVLIIWLSAIFGALNLDKYAKAVKDTKDGAGLTAVSQGVNLIVFYLLLSTPLNLIRTYFRNDNPEIIPVMTIGTNLLYVGFYMAAFFLLYKGSKKLLDAYEGAKSNTTTTTTTTIGLAGLTVVMYYFLEFIFSNTTRTIGIDASRTATYFLPDSLIILTVAIPSFVIWGLSIFTLANLHEVSHRAFGEIYKKAINNVLFGLLFIIIGTVITQSFSALGSEKLLAAGLTWLLVLIYILLGFIILGYFLIALGARKLNKIEEV